MSSVNSIASDKLARLIGTPKCPALLDVRSGRGLFGRSPACPRLRSPLVRRRGRVGGRVSTADRSSSSAQKGLKLSHGVAALLREAGASAEVLEGGFAAWAQSGLSLVPASKLPPRNRQGRTVVGDARAAEDRPHRLPVADPALCRSRRAVPVRRAFGSRRRSPSNSAARPSISKGCSGAIAARPAPST